MANVNLFEFFGVPADTPIIMSASSLFVTVTQGDVKKAERGSCTKCVYARSLKKAFNSEKAIVWRHVAYVLCENYTLGRQKGKAIVKFQLPAFSRRALKSYDESGTMPSHTIEFLPVSNNARKSHGAREVKPHDGGTKIKRAVKPRSIILDNPLWRPRAFAA